MDKNKNSKDKEELKRKIEEKTEEEKRKKIKGLSKGKKHNIICFFITNLIFWRKIVEEIDFIEEEKKKNTSSNIIYFVYL